MPSETSFLALVREVTKTDGRGSRASTRPVAEQLALAVDEAATNVIEHAYRGAPDREVRAALRGPRRASSGSRSWTRARWWTRASVPRVDLDRYVTERRTGGLGVHLMEKIMDSVTFRRSARPQRLLPGEAQGRAEADRTEPRTAMAAAGVFQYQQALDEFRREGGRAAAAQSGCPS